MDRRALLISAAVGAGVAVVGGVLYTLLREGEDEFGVPSSAYRKKDHATSRPITIEVKIAETDAGIVIGRGGENIKEIQRKTNTRINFKDEMATETERFLVIRGLPDDAQLAEVLIHQTIVNQPQLETIEMRVPDKATGRIIGKKGDTIRRIQTQSRCKVDIEKGLDATGLKKITLKGTSEQLSHAKRLINEKVEEEEEMQKRINNSVRNRPPRLKYREQLFLESENGGADDNSSHSSSSGTAEQYERLHVAAGESTCGVFVSAISDPSRFYVQKVGPRSVDLDKLVQEMTNFYGSSVNRQLHSLNEVSVGDFVAAQWPGDRQWYRAKVVEVIKDEYDEANVDLEVDFIDFGDCERKAKNEVCDLRTDFLKLSFQAIECALGNVKPSGDTWMTEAIDDFEKLTKCAKWKELQAAIVDYRLTDSGLIPVIELTDTSSPEVINISLELVKRGHAIGTKEENVPANVSESNVELIQNE